MTQEEVMHILIKSGKPMTRKEIELNIDSNTVAICNVLKRLIKSGEIKRILNENTGRLIPKYQLIINNNKRKKRKRINNN